MGPWVSRSSVICIGSQFASSAECTGISTDQVGTTGSTTAVLALSSTSGLLSIEIQREGDEEAEDGVCVVLEQVAGAGLGFDEVDDGATEGLNEVERKEGYVEFPRKVSVCTDRSYDEGKGEVRWHTSCAYHPNEPLCAHRPH